MSKPDKSIDPRILKSAKEEFLSQGYEKASLKTICANAKVTTGALYKRYKSKEELFTAVVTPTLEALNEVADNRRINFETVTEFELIEAWNMNNDVMLWWFKFLYSHYDGFILLLSCSQGTSFSNFTHYWVEKMSIYTYEYYLEAKNRGIFTTEISKTEFHTLLSSFWTTIYEPFIHGFSWEQIENHCQIVCHFFNWYQVLGYTR